VVFTANHLTVTDKQTIRKKTQYKSQKYTDKHNTDQRKQTTKHTAETKLPWFSHLLRHSARKRGGLILQRPRAPHGPIKVKRLKVSTFIYRHLQGNPDQQPFTTGTGVLAGNDTRWHSANSGSPLPEWMDFGPHNVQL